MLKWFGPFSPTKTISMLIAQWREMLPLSGVIPRGYKAQGRHDPNPSPGENFVISWGYEDLHDYRLNA